MAKANNLIEIVGEDLKLPFSIHVLASSLTTIGIKFNKAYNIARRVRNRLNQEGRTKIDRDKLRQIVAKELENELDKVTSQRYLKFRKIMGLEKPLIILLGGSTGSGKSTVSVELAQRLDITSMFTTDIVREIMRALFSNDILPMIHTSSYLASEKFWVPVKESKNQKIIAFREQALRVNAGIKSIIRRSIVEKTSLIINGVHILPELIDENEFPGANIVKAFVYIEDEEEHKNRFHMRGRSTEDRAAEKYLKNIEAIRMIQDYIIKGAKKRDYPYFNNINSIKTTKSVVNNIIDKISVNN
ncbi:MAG: hypothetical protein ACQEQC_02475 [Elusimicrobiota bacterium]